MRLGIISLLVIAGCLIEQEETGFRIALQALDVYFVPAQNRLDLIGGAVSPPYPHHFGRRATDQAQLVEVRILGDQGVAMLPGKCPYGVIRCLPQIMSRNVGGAWVEISQAQTRRKTRRKVFVQQPPHAAPAI